MIDLKIGSELFEVSKRSGSRGANIRKFFIVGETPKYWQIAHRMELAPFNKKIKKEDLTEHSSSYRSMILVTEVSEEVIIANKKYVDLVEFKRSITHYTKSNFHHMKGELTALDRKIFELLKDEDERINSSKAEKN